MITLTDDRGRVVYDPAINNEPPVSSIVMTGGNYGNAWQRHGNDGLWHSTTGGKRRWSQLLRMRNLVLVYEATERVPHVQWRGAVSGRMTTDGSCLTEVDRDHS